MWVLDDIELTEYLNEEFKPPEKHYCEGAVKTRLAEVRAVDTFLWRCLEHLNREPEDVAYDYIFELEMLAMKAKWPGNQRMLKDMQHSIEKIYKFLKGRK